MRRSISAVLERHGYRTVHSDCAAHALSLLADSAVVIDLVLADFRLPDKNGFELLHGIRHHSTKPDVPVVFMSTEQQPARHFWNVGLKFSAWVRKPIRPDQLILKIERMLH